MPLDLNPQMGGAISQPQYSQESSNIESLAPATDNIDTSDIKGLSAEEKRDRNSIVVTLRDSKTPIIVLFGPPACGKTMTLVRLTRYLNKALGYSVEPDRNFRPTRDTYYQQMCNEFNSLISREIAADSTPDLSFMLVRVTDTYGNLIAQILEAPGEHYYDPSKSNEPDNDFPRYIHMIKNAPNRKIWCYMTEPQWKFAEQSTKYVSKINKLKSGMRPGDKALFIFNKVDCTPFVISSGVLNMKAIKKEVSDLYPGIFTRFVQKTIFGVKEKFDLLPFFTGNYPDGAFAEGPDEYPAQLWDTLIKRIRG